MREAVRYNALTGADGVCEVFDTHAHLYDARFPSEGITPEVLLQNAASAGVTRILIPADNIETSRLAIEYVKKYDGMSGVELFCSVGVHPHEASSYSPSVEKELRMLLDHRDELKICAIGEIGLDYYYDLSPRDVQREVYRRQLDLAFEYDMPFILHERDASGDSTDILREYYRSSRLRSLPGVCHCCSCSPEIAQELVKMGFYIGFDGPLTFKNNRNGPEVLKRIPMERVVIETDSPYLTPEPNRGMINEPGFVPFVAEKIASIKELSVEEVIKVTAWNGKKLYNIK